MRQWHNKTPKHKHLRKLVKPIEGPAATAGGVDIRVGIWVGGGGFWKEISRAIIKSYLTKFSNGCAVCRRKVARAKNSQYLLPPPLPHSIANWAPQDIYVVSNIATPPSSMCAQNLRTPRSRCWTCKLYASRVRAVLRERWHGGRRTAQSIISARGRALYFGRGRGAGAVRWREMWWRRWASILPVGWKDKRVQEYLGIDASVRGAARRIQPPPLADSRPPVILPLVLLAYHE